MEGFLKILQIGSSTGEYNTGEKFVLVAGKLQLVPYVGKNFFCTCSDNIVQQGQFEGTAVFRREIAQDVLPNIQGVREPSKYDQDINDAYNLALKTINASVDGSITADELIASMTDELLIKQPDLEK